MPSGGDDLSRLSQELSGLVAGDIPELIAEARAEARTRVRALLAEAMAEAMLAEARHPATTPPRSPTGTFAEPRAAASSLLPDAAPAPTGSAVAAYVYGVTAAGDAGLARIGGVDPDHPVELIVAADLAAVVSAVPLTEFDEARLRGHLGDLGWVETIARRHEDVLEAVTRTRTVIPMRLCSIYHDRAGVEQMLRREAPALYEALELLAGHAEWGVKAFAVGTPPAAADPVQTEDGADTGLSYLERRRDSRRRRVEAGDVVGDACGAVHERLSALATRAQVLPPQRPEVSGHDGAMVLNGVYLVRDDTVDAFHAAVAALRQQVAPAAVELVATGPWPAYNFVPDAIGVPT